MDLEAVDLGLPSGTLWASQNLLADRPWAPGEEFYWGGTQPFKESQGLRYLDGIKVTKYNFDEAKGVVDNRYILEPEDDAATANLGDGWRMPTRWEFEELRDFCNWKEEEIHGERCYVVSSKVNAKSIIIPCSIDSFGAASDGYFYLTNCVYDSDCTYAWIWSEKKLNCGARSYQHGLIRPVYAGRVPVERIRIEIDDSSKPAGTIERMKVMFTPAGALDRRIEWKSSADSVAFIDSEETLVALFPGEAKIQATSPSSGLTMEAEVVVTDYITPEKIDLGLPSGLLWADRNLGAIDKEDYGLVFCWGATRPRVEDQIVSHNRPVSYSRHAFYPAKEAYSDGVLSLEYDAANVILGEGWRLPTREDFQELREYTTYTYTDGTFTYTNNGGSVSFQSSAYYWTSKYQDESNIYIEWGWNQYAGSTRSCTIFEFIRPVFDPKMSKEYAK